MLNDCSQLDADCTIKTIKTLHSRLLDSFSQSGPVTFDASQVEVSDVSFVQLIASATKLADREGRTFRLSGMSDDVLRSFRRAGLDI